MRPKFTQRKIRLVGPVQLATAMALLPNLPLDQANPLELVIREEVKARKPDQNALYWAGPLKDISDQCWIGGKQYTSEVWADYFKRLFLPDEYDAELCKDETYIKWSYGPDGEPVLVGSSTDLTIKGFAQYLEQIHAFGANLGVQFHEAPQRG